MKKSKNKKNKPRTSAIKDLAAHFEEDLKKSLPIVFHPNGVITYKKYAIVKMSSDNWGVYDLQSKDLVDQYHLKTCAIMSAKAYNDLNLKKFYEIKRLDSGYWSNFYDNQIYQKNITTAKELHRYIILLNKLEYSQEKTDFYRSEISRMFKYTFA
jgi:hypothetical protein